MSLKSVASLAALVSLAVIPWQRIAEFDNRLATGVGDIVALAGFAALALASWRKESWAGALGRIVPLWGWIALGSYLGMSLVSIIVSPDRGAGMRLLGARVLVAAVFMLFGTLAAEVSFVRRAAVVVGVNAVATSMAAAAGLIAFYTERSTDLIGAYGSLQESASYARVQAGFDNPNLLASYCLFAMGLLLVVQPRAPWLRTGALIATSLTLAATRRKRC